VSAARDLETIAGLAAVPPELRGAAVAIGNFDGVHRGHQALLGALRREAEARRRPALVVTFEPHPSAFFGEPLFRITPLAEKTRLMRALGIDAMVVVPFDEALASKPAEAFIAELTTSLAPSAVVAGKDFRFGRDRAGTVATLARAGEAHGFGLVAMPSVLDPSGLAYSSARIRTALSGGEVEAAAALLGYRWFVCGEVIHGDKRGRELGFPTANIALAPSTRLRHGIYAVRVRRGSTVLDGVANFGVRPTFATTAGPLLEVFLFDFAGNLYGETLEVSFLAWIRPEARFDSVDALVARIREDEFAARAILASAGAGTPLDQRLAATNS
jgi:riboflavin kinase/FMN adenylyltransferase